MPFLPQPSNFILVWDTKYAGLHTQWRGFCSRREPLQINGTFVICHISSYDSIKSVEALKHLKALTQSSVLPCAGSEYCAIDSLVDFGTVS